MLEHSLFACAKALIVRSRLLKGDVVSPAGEGGIVSLNYIVLPKTDATDLIPAPSFKRGTVATRTAIEAAIAGPWLDDFGGGHRSTSVPHDFGGGIVPLICAEVRSRSQSQSCKSDGSLM